MQRHLFAIAASGLLVATGCSDERAGGCKSAADCDAGSICYQGRCRVVCVVQGDCPAGMFCSNEGVCAVTQGGATPVITNVAGNEVGDPARVRDGLWVIGMTLGDAVFELTTPSASYPLTARSQTDTQVELVLPVDVRSGAYTLVATNQSGSDQATVTLELPELGPDVILSRLNAATGTILFARLPVGTSTGMVAAGDHDHDGVYAPANDPLAPAADGNLVPNHDFTEGASFLDLWTVALSGSGPTASVVDVTLGVGPKAFQNGPLTRAQVTSEARIPVDPTRIYRLRGRFRDLGSGSAGSVYLGLRCWDQSNAELLNGTDCHVYAALAEEPGTSWTPFATAFGAGTAKPLPPSARTMSIAFVINADAGNPTLPGNRQFQVQDLALYNYTVEPAPVRTAIGTSITLTADDAGVVTLNPAAATTVTLPLADAYSGLGLELFNRSDFLITVVTGTGALVSPIAPRGFLHLVAVADPPAAADDWAVRVRSPVAEYITASGTWTVPQGLSLVHAILVGGGGGGGGGGSGSGATNYGGGGGGGGGGVRESLVSVSPGQVWSITIGNGGNGGNANYNGTVGAPTTFTAPGGTVAYSSPGGGFGYEPPASSYQGGNGGAGGFGAATAAGAGGSYDNGTVYPGGAAGILNGGGGGGAYNAASGSGAATAQAAGGNSASATSSRGGGGGGGASWGQGGSGGEYDNAPAAEPGRAFGGGGGGGAGGRAGAAGAPGAVILLY